ncbi:non-ribosomal peptide synthetase [Longimicrobium terrae]|uniref:Amino acid adenylation domain-containing protein n=1 Tax=Longimicrobium terrae TaxID=1639882 RepID=A0A841H285_9BACT|nr:non-ribosomal peptide synthetase [Longimicrobium terrae]MBB4637954.1 amino acid adenylation domain-containing protein [Longimicrobium terrae]MBB6072201.1 amino acid adenylation domain-containing protein [Longimicrobium terrae]NNC28373.1 amino acid adenylation domain-containing protein [Longimicrobium terrae]
MSTHDITAKRASLSDDKRALLQRRLRGEAPALRPRELVTRAAGPGPEHPASFAQERMWFLNEFAPDSPMYNVPVSVLVQADLDVALLERAYSEVVRRHESLRTTFHMGPDGELKQLVHDPFEVRIEIIEMRHRVGEDFSADVNALVSEEAARTFRMDTLPLFRVTLLRVSDEDYAMVITLHHIIIDGWSYPVVLREVVDLYGAYAEGRPSPLTDPTLRYADFAVWQRQFLTGETLEKQVSYWRDSLAGGPVLELPTDHPRPAVSSFRGRFHRFRFDARLTGQLRDLCREDAVTLNMVIMAGFYVLLHRYSGQDDVVVGTLLGNRSRAEVEQIVGVFVNTAALRMDLSGNPTFRDVVRRTRDAVLQADVHQDLPFEKLVDLLGIERDLSRHPVFQALYFHHTFVRTHRELTVPQTRVGLATRPVDADQDVSLVDTGVAKFDLMLATVETLSGLGAKMEYSTDLFEHETIVRLSEHLRTLLDSASLSPDTGIDDLPMMGEAEERTVAESWAAGPPLDAPIAPIHVLCEAQAERTPDATAVVAGTERVTFRELDNWANRIAAVLVERGVKPGDVVGVRMERTAAMVAALVGIWKAGGAYLPLEPDYPAERIAFMRQDTGAALVIVDAGAAADELAVPARPAAGEVFPRPDVEVSVSDLAYLLFTSGSTGRPKAVEIEHGTTAAYLGAVVRDPGLAENDVLLSVTTTSFDISVLELFGPLITGARLVLASREEATDALALARMLEAEKVTVMQATPASWRMLIHAGWNGHPGLRVLCGGEALTTELAEGLLARAGEVINVYGPTECTVWATFFRAQDGGEGILPIGRPIAGARARVLDAALRPTPIGVPGELWISGAGVGRGYHNRPELTAERFVANPFPDGGPRMYRTGDRVRWSSDGQLIFMGRLDTQVKLRGYRIELGEIEATLLRHSSVAQAAALVREDVPGDPRLVAYVVPSAEGEPAGADLRAFLRERLPEYMVPATYVTVDAMPMTTTGKIDRRSLPAPQSETVSDAERIAPRTVVEEMVSDIWTEVLRRDDFGVEDNFFTLGGHSLLATQVLARIAQTFEVEIRIRTFFEHPTIAGVSEAVEGAGSPVLARMVDELADLSPEEIEALLAEAGD